jgi:hypothetical protein
MFGNRIAICRLHGSCSRRCESSHSTPSGAEDAYVEGANGSVHFQAGRPATFDLKESMTPNSGTVIERRRRRRFSVNAPVTLTVAGREIPAFTRDMNSLGLYLYVNSLEGFCIGQDLDILVKLPPEITLSTFYLIRRGGRLVRMADTTSELTGIAVEFL